MRERIETGKAPKPIGPYSQAVRANGFIFVSGQIAIDPDTGNVVEGDIAAQTHRVLRNVAAILEEAGSGMDRVVKTSIFLTDMGDFAELNRVYEEYLGSTKPARATVAVSGLPKGVRVEIEAVALA